MPGPAPDERMRPKGRRNTQGIQPDPEAESTHQPRLAVLSALVKHEPGVPSEVSSLFSRRQFNIESLTVGPTVDGDVARMTIVIEEPDPGVQQAKNSSRSSCRRYRSKNWNPRPPTRNSPSSR